MASFAVSAADMDVTLSGDQEVPSVTTMASGEAQFSVDDDMILSGSVKTTGITATAAHIHAGAAGTNGPVTISLMMKGENEWVVPADTKLTAEQMTELEAGLMYVNVHSAEHKGGEIRAQLQ
ncbi:MAG: CHRD domain-containing protein [Woeseia sp.]